MRLTAASVEAHVATLTQALETARTKAAKEAKRADAELHAAAAHVARLTQKLVARRHRHHAQAAKTTVAKTAPAPTQSTPPASPPPPPQQTTVRFEAGPLGMVIGRTSCGPIVVTAFVSGANGQAQASGRVAIGDQVVAINGGSVDGMGVDGFKRAVRNSGRPIHVTFRSVASAASATASPTCVSLSPALVGVASPNGCAHTACKVVLAAEAAAKADVDALQQQIARLETRVTALTSDLETARLATAQAKMRQVAQADSEASAAAAQVTTLQAQLARVEATTQQQLRHQLDTLRQHHRAQAAEYARTAADLQATLDQARSNSEMWFTRAVQAMQAVETLNDEVATLKAAAAAADQAHHQVDQQDLRVKQHGT